MLEKWYGNGCWSWSAAFCRWSQKFRDRQRAGATAARLTAERHKLSSLRGDILSVIHICWESRVVRTACWKIKTKGEREAGEWRPVSSGLHCGGGKCLHCLTQLDFSWSKRNNLIRKKNASCLYRGGTKFLLVYPSYWSTGWSLCSKLAETKGKQRNKLITKCIAYAHRHSGALRGLEGRQYRT